jgi:hypothetical protein
MTVRILRRLIQGGWVAVAVVAVVLLVDTGEFIRSAGLFAVRPPLSTTQTALRLVIVAGAIASLAVFRRTLERITLMLGVAAAGSSALYGVGLRFQGLAAFRLLSHFVLYLFALACAVTALYADARQARQARSPRAVAASVEHL